MGVRHTGCAIGAAIARPPVRDGEKERVVHVHRGMIRREVERAEVVPLGLDFGSGGPREAQAVEDLDDLLGDSGDRMLRPNPAAAAGHGEIHPFTGARLGFDLERLAPLVEGGLQVTLERVGAGAQLRLLGRGEAWESLEDGGETSLLAAEQRDVQRFELLRAQRRDARQLLERSARALRGPCSQARWPWRRDVVDWVKRYGARGQHPDPWPLTADTCSI